MEDNLHEKNTESRMVPRSYGSDDISADMVDEIEDFNQEYGQVYATNLDSVNLTQETANEESQLYIIGNPPNEADTPYPTTNLPPYSKIVNTSHTYQSPQCHTSNSQSFTPQSCNDPVTSSPTGEIVIKNVTARKMYDKADMPAMFCVLIGKTDIEKTMNDNYKQLS